MKVKYYGVPHNAITFGGFLLARGVKVSSTHSERLFSLYKWLLEKPRQWEDVGFASSRAKAPSCYSGLSDSTFCSDVRLLARLKLVFPMFREAAPDELFERLFPVKSLLKDHMKDPAFVKSMQEIIHSQTFFPESDSKKSETK